MDALIAIPIIGFVLFFIVGTIALVGFLLKLLFWVVLFPVRLVFKLLFGLIGLTLGAVLMPFLLLVAGIAVIGLLVAGLVAILTPLLPVILLGLVGWAIYRISARRPSPVI